VAILAGFTALAGLCVMLQMTAPNAAAARWLSRDVVTLPLATLALGAGLLAALVCWLIWGVSGDQRALTVGVAISLHTIVVFVCGILLPRIPQGGASPPGSLAFDLAELPVLAVFAISATRAPIETGRRWTRVVLGSVLLAAAVGLVDALVHVHAPGSGDLQLIAGLPSISILVGALVVLGWVGVAALHLRFARRADDQLLRWTALVATGMAVARAFAFGDQSVASPALWLQLSASMAFAVVGFTWILFGRYSDLQRRVLHSLVDSALLISKAHTAEESRAEHRHEAHAALLGMEAAAQAMSRHRGLLSQEQFHELSEALVAEVHRLHALIDEDPVDEESVGDGALDIANESFDLLDVVTPVVVCARANGLVVDVDIPPETIVKGSPEATAQVVTGLLANARRHAPGSPVSLRVAHDDQRGVVLSIGDHGPGIPEIEREHVFERGVSTHPDGSGVGLHVARRLMRRQGGSISLATPPDHDRGATFDLQFNPPGAGPLVGGVA
jgi:signal transduction histidine kinase